MVEKKCHRAFIREGHLIKIEDAFIFIVHVMFFLSITVLKEGTTIH